MATLTVIVGYCGSGKSWWLEQRRRDRPDAHFMEEGAQVYPSGGLHEDVARALRAGKDCFVGLMDCLRAGNRAALVGSAGEKAPGTTIKWVFYENDVTKANKNVCRDAARERDEKGNIEQNLGCAGVYNIPPDSELLPVHPLPDRGRNRRLKVTLVPKQPELGVFEVAKLMSAEKDVTYLARAAHPASDLGGLKDCLAELTGDDVELEEA
jgi:hypothetical protein